MDPKSGGHFFSPMLQDQRGREMMTAEHSHPMDTAKHDPETPLLLFCPDQGGWNIGVWLEGRWVDYASASVALEPVRWLPVPPEPVDP